MKTLVTLLLIGMSLQLTSCDETKKVIDAAGNVQLAGTYDINSVGGSEITGITLSFNALEKTIRGNGGCNTYFGNYTLDLYALSFSDIGATEMSCGNPKDQVEHQYMMALGNTGSYTIEKGVLTLFSKTDRSELLTAVKQKSGEN